MNALELKYTEILARNSDLTKSLHNEKYKISILSNITLSQLNEILEYILRIEKISAVVKSAAYDSIVQESFNNNQCNLVIIFWELCNIFDGLQYKIELYDENQLHTIIDKIKSEIDLVLTNLKKTPLILFNKFTALQFSNTNIRNTNLEILAEQLNQYVETKKLLNVKLVDLGKVIARLGVKNCLDLRYYYSSKALYTIDFFKAYAEHIKPYVMSAIGKSKKAIIFDCDNTLWKGILGEDGCDNIEMSPTTKDGLVFSEIQSMALALTKRGILIGLCSKNNPDDVEEVIQSHPDMQLKDEHITVKKINWADKVTNLREIACDLNIGLDSLVYVDDSPFEVNLIKEQLPEVTVLQVPDRLYEYTEMLSEHMNLFYNLSLTPEDRKKTDKYHQQLKRENAKKKYSSIEAYLAALELKMAIVIDDKSIIPRMSQITQKTNQFNLTTRRYTEGEIGFFVESKKHKVYAISVADRYGDSGVTGLSIINVDNTIRSADIDTFLMSCRILSRNIEFAFMDYLVEDLKKYGVTKITAKYIKTPKNEQVKDFYHNCTFSLAETKDAIINYALDISDYKPRQLRYIEINNGR